MTHTSVPVVFSTREDAKEHVKENGYTKWVYEDACYHNPSTGLYARVVPYDNGRFTYIEAGNPDVFKTVTVMEPLTVTHMTGKAGERTDAMSKTDERLDRLERMVEQLVAAQTGSTSKPKAKPKPKAKAKAKEKASKQLKDPSPLVYIMLDGKLQDVVKDRPVRKHKSDTLCIVYRNKLHAFTVKGANKVEVNLNSNPLEEFAGYADKRARAQEVAPVIKKSEL